MGLEPVGTVMMFYGLVLFLLGWMALGKADARSAGFIALLGGLVGFIMGFYVYLATMLAATLLLIFATTFITSGVHLMFGLNIKGLGWLCVIWGIADAIYAGYFAMINMPIFSAFCTSWFILVSHQLFCHTADSRLPPRYRNSIRLKTRPPACNPFFYRITGLSTA